MRRHEQIDWSVYDNEIKELFYSEEIPNVEIARRLIAKYDLDAGRTETFRMYISRFLRSSEIEKDFLKENVRLAKNNQSLADKNRIQNKSFREYSRIENALVQYNEALVTLVKKEGLKLKTYSHKEKVNNCVMVVHLSDLHFNELVNLPSNKYDFYIASKRLMLFANDIIRIGKVYDIKRILIADTGDNLNSDRRLDELLMMATNRAKATQLSILLLEYFILHLNKHFNIDVAFVTGNESRAKQELGWSEILASDNYDFTIFDTLKLLFRGKNGINFHNCGANEQVVCVNGKNLLLVHGHQLSANNMQKSIQELVGKYASKGSMIDFVISGHVHSSYISDYFSRGASLVGSNAYSEEALNFVSKASQNIHLFHKHNKIDSIKLDLQNVDGIEGYPMEANINAYNAKSASKVKNNEVVFKIVI
jgi:predicted phosphodiesterase